MTIGLIILAIIVVIVIAIISMYNSLVKSRIKVDNAWSQIDVQLQRRFDLIPNFVETVKGYMTHEKETFEKITSLRSSWSDAKTVSEKASLDSELSNTLNNEFSTYEQLNLPDILRKMTYNKQGIIFQSVKKILSTPSYF